MKDDNNNRGCLGGLMQLFLLKKTYDWGQKNFGSERGGCCGCAIGVVLFLAFVYFALSIIFGTDWLKFSF